jgi:HSP20 family protein
MANKEKQQVAVSGSDKPAAAGTPSVWLRHPFDELEPLFERFMGRSWLRPSALDWPLSGMKGVMEARMPSVDIVDREAELVVRAEVPGIDKKDIDVSITDNTVTIKGSVSREQKEEKGDYYRCEISRGAFSRTVTLPCNVDGSKVKAAMKDGVLEITLPKVAQSKRQSVRVE